MYPKIEIADTAFKAMKGTSAKSGKPYDLAMQEAYLHKGGKYPDKLEIPLHVRDAAGNWQPYPVGWYTLTPDSYESRDGRLSINGFEMKLVKLPEEKAAPVKAA